MSDETSNGPSATADMLSIALIALMAENKIPVFRLTPEIAYAVRELGVLLALDPDTKTVTLTLSSAQEVISQIKLHEMPVDSAEQ